MRSGAHRPDRHRACDDFRRTTEAERRRALGSGLSRRDVLIGGVGAGLAIYAGRALPLAEMLSAAEADAAARPDAPILVSVFLPGGTDLLDTLVPIAEYGRYADLHSLIRVSDSVKLGATGLGMHPSLSKGWAGGIKGLFDRGKVGLLPGIDYANPDLSHFHSRIFWETGLINLGGGNGWLGRWLDANGGTDNPFQGVSMSSGLSPVLRSAGAPVAAVSSPAGAQLQVPGLGQEGLLQALEAYASLGRVRRRGVGPVAAGRSGRQALQVSRTLEPFVPKGGKDPLAPQIAYPAGNRLAGQLQQLAGLLSLPVGIRIATVEADGDFDTHAGQATRLLHGLDDVSEALSFFQADLEVRGLADRVLTFVWSEFGRRPKQNASLGTDHGAGGVAWVQGNAAKSGVLCDYPDLRSFDAKDNLKVTMDFRTVYSSLLESWLGTDADQVIPGSRAFGRVGLLK